ncbi:MAG: hypothetical protein U0746_15080 [Gemmataceae bacterium]
MWRYWLTALVGVAWLGVMPSSAAEPPLVEQYLHGGKFADGEKALVLAIRDNPKDDQARFGLGVLQFVRAVEHLGQSLHRYGLRSDRGQAMNVPFLRLPVPPNAKPELIGYADFRKVFQDLVDDLRKAEATLAEVHGDEIRLPLRVGLIRLDLTGGGTAGDRFETIVSRYMGRAGNAAKDSDWLVVFDRGDVAWLRGYCHLLMALSEVILAHDGQELFDCTAHLFFGKPRTHHTFLTALPEREAGPFNIEGLNIVDLIAFVHLIRLPVKETDRMKSALTHLERMLALSKESWKYILAEKDDDHEWLPNPNQKGVLGVPIRREMIDRWLGAVDEAEAVLAGKRLVPFWRGTEKRGINLRRVFTEPRALDLVLWVQGTAATPYLEEGPLTQPAVWDQLLRVFGGDFIGFAAWFN